jgi:hypothetical protein
MWSYRVSAMLGVLAGVAMIALGAAGFLERNDSEYVIQNADSASSGLLAACGATVLFAGMGALVLSFSSRKAVPNRQGGYTMRASAMVVILFCAAAATTVAAAALALSILVSGKPTGEAAWVLLIAVFFGLISLAVLATTISALLGKVWYPSIRSDKDSALDVRTFGSRRIYAFHGAYITPAEKTGVFVEGKPVSVEKGLLLTLLSAFSTANKTRSGVSTIRTTESNLRAFVDTKKLKVGP